MTESSQAALMVRPEYVAARTHDLARALLRRPDVRFRAVVWGRLSVTWDDKPTHAGDQTDG